MKICAIISEYNPFHNGHKYHINEVKKILPDAKIISIMSGNYVQRGEPAVFDKYKRTETALKNGIDMVIELPPSHAVNNSDKFAELAFDIIKLLNITTHFSFGCEINDINIIRELTKIDKNYVNKSDMSYIKNFDILNSSSGTIKNSNLILAKDYLKYSDKIIPVPIKRIGSNYNEVKEGKFMSATHLRHIIYKDNIENHLSIDDFSDIIKYKLIMSDISDKNSLNYKLLKRINKNIYFAENIDKLVNLSYAKNISKSTIKRFLIKNIFNFHTNPETSYVNILGFKKDCSYLINAFSKVINFYKNYSKLDNSTKKLIKQNSYADEVYNIILNRKYYMNVNKNNKTIIM